MRVQQGYKGEVQGMITYDFNFRLPSLNEYTRACRTNAYVGAKMKSDIEEQLMWAIKAQGIKRPNGRVLVRFVWREKTKKRDLDNIAFAKKFILDAFVHMGVLEDDSQKYVVGFEDWLVQGEDGVRVTIEEVAK